MKYGVLGTGMVGQALASKLVQQHEVMMGARSADHKDAASWLQRSGPRGHIGTFGEAAHFGDVLLNCTQGAFTLDVLRSLDRKDLAGKLLIDVANPLSS